MLVGQCELDSGGTSRLVCPSKSLLTFLPSSLQSASAAALPTLLQNTYSSVSRD